MQSHNSLKNRHISIAELLDSGQQAVAYARSQILIGDTHLENNILTHEQRSYNEDAIKVLRVASKKAAERNLRFFQHDLRQTLRPLENDFLSLNRDYVYFESFIKFTTKMRTGNCGELAMQALHYVINHIPNENIEAQVYKIENGDHGFLLLRDKNDEQFKSHDPKTWGRCVICDPWANKVFLAKDYLSELNIFYQDQNKKRCVSIFNPEIHSTLPAYHNKTTTLHLRISTILKKIFLDKILDVSKLYKDLYSRTKDSIKSYEREHLLEALDNNTKIILKRDYTNYDVALREMNLVLHNLNDALMNVLHHLTPKEDCQFRAAIEAISFNIADFYSEHQIDHTFARICVRHNNSSPLLFSHGRRLIAANEGTYQPPNSKPISN